MHFKLPGEGGGIRSYHIAKRFIREGHRVSVITLGKPGFEVRENIHIYRVGMHYANQLNTFRRLLVYSFFALRAAFKAKNIPRPAFFYIISTPLTVGITGIYLKRTEKVPFVFEVGDLWPAVPFAMGYFKNNWIRKRLFCMEKKIYKEAWKIVALSPTIKSYIRKITGKKPLVTIPNMADPDFFISKENPLKPFKILYAGTLGKANQLEYLLNLANHSQKEGFKWHFQIMGDGAEKNKLIRKTEQYQLKNITWLPSGDKEAVKNAYNDCHAVFLSFQPLPILHTGSPNKFFDGLAAGKMIISNLGGWTSNLIQRYQLGITYDPENPEVAVIKISEALKNQQVMVYAGNSKRMGEQLFNKEAQLHKLYSFLKLSNTHK